MKENRENQVIKLINNINKYKKERKGKRKRGNKEKMYIKMEDLTPNMLVIILNVNQVNAPIHR